MSTPSHVLSRMRAIMLALTAVPALALLLAVLCAPKTHAAEGADDVAVLPVRTIAASDSYTLSLPLVLTGCKPPGPEYPVCVLTASRAALYSGPGSEYYTWLGNLRAKESVVPLAQYGDYTQVAATVDGSVQVGFVPTSALSPLPAGLPFLGVAEVPWKEVDFAKALLLSPIVTSTGDTVVIDNTAGAGWNDVMPVAVEHMTPFTLTFQIDTDNDSQAMIKLADVAASATDQWWKDVRRLDIYTDKGKLGFALYDGSDPSPAAYASWNVSDQQVITVFSRDSTGKVFFVLDQKGKQIGKIDVTALNRQRLAQGLFPEGRAYFGRVVAPESLLTLRSLSLRLQPSGMLESLPDVAREPTLRRLADAQGIPLGTDFEWWLMLADSDYRRIIESVYSTLILSHFSSPSFWPERGAYEFEEVDSIVNWAMRFGYRTRASHLVWGAPEFLPSWLVNSNLTRDEYIQILEEHVRTIVGHYKGRIQEWSIANEAIGRAGNPGADFWNEKIGSEYIAMAFRWARETDPDAVLIFNETNNESPRDDGTRWIVETMLAKVEELKAQGVPVDVVGMQMHLLLPGQSQIPPTKDGVLETMQRFGTLDVRVYITEMDVNLEAVQGTQEEKWQFEADLYRNMAEACIESGVCDSFSTWGVSDKDSWLTCTEWSFCQKLPNADPLMFDRNYQPKPAFFAVHGAFARGVAVSGGQ